MRAAVFDETGDADVLRVVDVDTPQPQCDEALIRVEAAALNRLDIAARNGRPETYPMPHIGGLDVVGEVVAVGAGASTVQTGARVVVYPVLSCGDCRYCRTGDSALCPEQRVFGFQTQGGFAEYCVAPARNLERAPESVDAAIIAALPTAYLTAWRMLARAARLRSGERVLIHSVGSGVGSASLQIAKYLGADVIGTASSDEKLRLALEMGADWTINYRQEDTARRVAEVTSGEGADVVVDVIGQDTWELSLRCASINGRIVTAGVTSGRVAETNIRHFYQKQLTARGCVIGGQSELRSLLALLSDGRLRPRVARVFPLDAIREAHRALESRELVGKVVVTDCHVT